MNFDLWSFWHFLYILSPVIISTIIYLSIIKSTNRTKNIIGYVLGIISILILVIRNIDIFIREGIGVEVIPLQVCHIGSLVAGLALLFRKKWLIATAFCFNLIPAFLAMVFADALVNYDTLLKIRPQTYIWGHILIIVCSLYGVFVYKPKLEKKDLFNSLIFVGLLAITAIICNSLFRTLFSWEPNYFYLFNYEGTPLKFLYNLFPSSIYGWFEINWFYTITLLVFFLCVFVFMFYLSKVLIKKTKN